MACRVVFQMGQTESANQALLRQIRECRQNSDLDRCAGLRPDRHRQKRTLADNQLILLQFQPDSRERRHNAIIQGLVVC